MTALTGGAQNSGGRDPPARKRNAMAVNEKTIEVEDDFQGGIILSSSGVKNGLLAAIDLGLIDKPNAVEILYLIREATQQLIATMND